MDVHADVEEEEMDKKAAFVWDVPPARGGGGGHGVHPLVEEHGLGKGAASIRRCVTRYGLAGYEGAAVDELGKDLVLEEPNPQLG